jgi:hypothetical protein
LSKTTRSTRERNVGRGIVAIGKTVDQYRTENPNFVIQMSIHKVNADKDSVGGDKVENSEIELEDVKVYDTGKEE